MKTTWKALTIFAGMLLVAGCAFASDAPPPKANTTTYGPGWRYEQMMQARANGTVPMRARMGRGMGYGPGYGYGYRAAVDASGNIDTTKLPPWCPYATKSPVTE